MQVEIAGGRLRTGRLIRETEGKCEAPQARGNQRRRQSLTTADEKVAPLAANEERIAQVLWFFCLTQRPTSRALTRKGNEHRRQSRSGICSGANRRLWICRPNCLHRADEENSAVQAD